MRGAGAVQTLYRRTAIARSPEPGGRMGLLSRKKPPEWIDVASEDGFRNSIAVVVGKIEYVVYRVGGELFCTEGSCSHEYSRLAEGTVMDGEIYCEKHGSRFDIRTGRVLSPPASDDLKTFPAKAEGGRVLILVPPAAGR